MKAQIIPKQQSTTNELSKEAHQILEILDQIENHTAALRTKLMAELKTKAEPIHLNLEEVE